MMKIFFINLSVLALSLFLLVSCSEKNVQGACESRHKTQDGYEYWCSQTDDASTCESDNDYTKEIYHSSSSCSDLGYSEGNSGSGSYIWYSPSGKSYPGSNGYFSGDTGGTTPTFCSNGYQNPGVGTQASSFCESAYTYLCNGYSETSDEVTTNCSTYAAMIEGSSLPACPYCP